MSPEEPRRNLQLRFLVVVGLVWAFTEVTFGTLVTASCPRGMTGSVLTGAALLFLSTAYYSGASRWMLAVPLLLAVGAKVAGAAALGRPMLSGAVANPCYAYAMELVALVVVLALVDARQMGKLPYAAAAGGVAGLLAANLFVPVGHVTGIAACIHEPTGVPLAIHYAPIAVVLSAAGVPLGRAVGLRAGKWMTSEDRKLPAPAGALNAAMGVALLALVIAQVILL
ncbi:MAG: hypothetical protein R6X33_17325 [Candidatus Brocadiia bacterium]